MHVAGKVFLGLGAVMLVVGGIMTVMGGDTISDIEWDVEGESIYEGPDGTYIHSADDLMIIYVDDAVDCESFTLTYTNTTDDSTGYDWDDDGVEDEPYFAKEDCEYANDGADPNGYYSIGMFNGEKGDYTVDGSESFYTVPLLSTLGGVVEEAASGIFAIIGGVGLAGCGICSLLLGGLLALVLKDNKPATVMTNQVQE